MTRPHPGVVIPGPGSQLVAISGQAKAPLPDPQYKVAISGQDSQLVVAISAQAKAPLREGSQAVALSGQAEAPLPEKDSH